jgi:hypothetical protein
MGPRRQAHEEGHVAKDAVETAALMEELEQPAAEKKREAAEREKARSKEAREGQPCKLCNKRYTDASGSGGGTAVSETVGFVVGRAGTRPRRAHKAANCKHARAPEYDVQGLRHGHGPLQARAPEMHVQGLRHGGHCKYGRRKDKCRDCGTGLCQQGIAAWRAKWRLRRGTPPRSFSTGHCQHGRRGNQCS